MVEFGQQLFRGLVVVESLTNKVLQVLVLSEDRKEVLLFEAGEELQFRFELPEQPLPRLSGVGRGVDELGKEFIGACRTALDKLANAGHGFSRHVLPSDSQTS